MLFVCSLRPSKEDIAPLRPAPRLGQRKWEWPLSSAPEMTLSTNPPCPILATASSLLGSLAYPLPYLQSCAVLQVHHCSGSSFVLASTAAGRPEDRSSVRGAKPVTCWSLSKGSSLTRQEGSARCLEAIRPVTLGRITMNCTGEVGECRLGSLRLL